MTRTIQSIGPKEVVHCPTEEQAIKFCRLMHDAGKRWVAGESYEYNTNWYNYKAETCYNVKDCTFSNIDYYRNEGYKITSCEEFFEQVPKSIECVWVWGKVDKAGLWAHGNMGPEPTFRSAKYHSETREYLPPSWIAYLGPLPEIKAPEVEYVELDFKDVDIHNLPQMVYTKSNDEYTKKALVSVTISTTEITYRFTDFSRALHIYSKKDKS